MVGDQVRLGVQCQSGCGTKCRKGSAEPEECVSAENIFFACPPACLDSVPLVSVLHLAALLCLLPRDLWCLLLKRGLYHDSFPAGLPSTLVLKRSSATNLLF